VALLFLHSLIFLPRKGRLLSLQHARTHARTNNLLSRTNIRLAHLLPRPRHTMTNLRALPRKQHKFREEGKKGMDGTQEGGPHHPSLRRPLLPPSFYIFVLFLMRSVFFAFPLDVVKPSSFISLFVFFSTTFF